MPTLTTTDHIVTAVNYWSEAQGDSYEDVLTLIVEGHIDQDAAQNAAWLDYLEMLGEDVDYDGAYTRADFDAEFQVCFYHLKTAILA
jgi:hypothetical protein